MTRLYCECLVINTGKTFIKYFSCEYDMLKFINKCRYSTKIKILKSEGIDPYDR